MPAAGSTSSIDRGVRMIGFEIHDPRPQKAICKSRRKPEVEERCNSSSAASDQRLLDKVNGLGWSVGCRYNGSNSKLLSDSRATPQRVMR